MSYPEAGRRLRSRFTTRPTSLEVERHPALRYDRRANAAPRVPKVGAAKPSRFGRTFTTSGMVIVEFGYARVSTVKQDLERQIEALAETGIAANRIYREADPLLVARGRDPPAGCGNAELSGPASALRRASRRPPQPALVFSEKLDRRCAVGARGGLSLTASG